MDKPDGSDSNQRQDVVNALLARNLFTDHAPQGQETEALEALELVRLDKPSRFIAFAALLAALAGDSHISFMSLSLALSSVTSKTELYRLVGEQSLNNMGISGTTALARVLGTSPVFVQTLYNIVANSDQPPVHPGHDEAADEAKRVRAKRIGKRLQRLRRTLRMSQETLAYPEFSPTYIEGIENGKIGSSDKALAILCKKLDIEVKDFLLDIEAEKLED